MRRLFQASVASGVISDCFQQKYSDCGCVPEIGNGVFQQEVRVGGDVDRQFQAGQHPVGIVASWRRCVADGGDHVDAGLAIGSSDVFTTLAVSSVSQGSRQDIAEALFQLVGKELVQEDVQRVLALCQVQEFRHPVQLFLAVSLERVEASLSPSA